MSHDVPPIGVYVPPPENPEYARLRQEKVERITRELLELDRDSRIEILRHLFGSGAALPETRDPDRDRFIVGNSEVDQQAFEFIEKTFGIFSVDQLGMSAHQVADAFTAEARTKAQLANANWYTNHFLSEVQNLKDTIRAVAIFVGAPVGVYSLPTADMICEAIKVRSAGGTTETFHHSPYGEPGGGIFGDVDGDLDRQLTIAEAAAGVGAHDPVALIIQQLLPSLEAYVGRPVDEVARELIAENSEELVMAALEAVSADRLILASALSSRLSSTEGTVFLRQLWDRLTELTIGGVVVSEK